MIVLPHTPPLPKQISVASDRLNSEIISKRSSLINAPTSNYNDIIRFVVSMEEYLEQLFEFTYENTGSGLNGLIKFASNYQIGSSAEPWTIKKASSSLSDKKINIKGIKEAPRSRSLEWNLFNEIELSILSISFSYTSIGSQLINELIEESSATKEVVEKWKQVVNFFKKAISFTQFGAQINRISASPTKINGVLYSFLEKLNNINIQLSILSKSSWTNREDFSRNESFKTNNNSTLARVAIYIVNELSNSQSILVQLQDDATGKKREDSNNSINLDYSYWKDYLGVIEKYAIANAGLFLSIENYQQDKLGEAIGLVNFSLLTLQKKKFDEKASTSSSSSSSGKPSFRKLQEKFKAHRNEAYVKNLESITTLNINNSAFQEKSSGIILKDLSYLFDQLILLHVKFTKVNDNLNFDQVASWSSINSDSRWPLGCQIPVSAVEKYQPRSIKVHPDQQERDAGQSGRTQYY
ncbi:hypothetical protein CLIB1423_07S03114 [[Candida] railenensis]|uniref:Uncharacterized protein n=1 Tax=[Candida] railenensis TaxID=45579 RepID=A0A9P0QPN9_9ASCO|nr:hypothetical protein CLIB1423_07S03114 [[Candida] railenensis]